MKKLVIFDGNSIMNRAFYGVRPLTTKEGLHTNAIYGYVSIIKKHLDAIKPDFAAVAFDMRAPTFRHKKFEGYKATRKPMSSELSMQVPYVHEVSKHLGLNVLMQEGYEADDILGCVAKKANEKGIFSYIVTGDRDSFQLVNEHTTVILASTAGDDEYTPEKIKEKYQVLPRQLIDIKAIAGDSSDNIPGVRGIGEKGAIKLISDAGSLENLYNNLDTLGLTPTLLQKLIDGKESAFLSRELGEICLDVPGIPEIESLLINTIEKSELSKLFTKLEFFRLIQSYGLDSIDLPAPKRSVENQISFDSIEEDPLDELEETNPINERDASQFNPDLRKKIFLSFNKNSDEIYLLTDGEIIKLTGDIPSLLLKISPVVFSYKDYCHLYAKLTKSYDIKGLKASFDLSTAAYLVNPSDNVGDIQKLSLIYLKHSISPANAGNAIFELGLYDELYNILSKEIETLGMHSLYYDIELPLSHTLAKMELYGFKVFPEGLSAYGGVLKERMSELETAIFDIAGIIFNLNSPKQLGEVLFERLNLPHFKKTKTGYSTDAETLDKLKPHSPIISKILEYRGLSKLYGTYVEGLLKVISEDGRIHTRFMQTLTQTGRLSSIEPNLQNIPIRTQAGRELRKFFIAQEGNVLIDADYSQIELRLLAHLSGDPELIEAFAQGIDIHTRTASEIFHVPLNEVTSEMRKSAKAVNFGIVYGIGDYSLSIDIGVSRSVAAAYIQRYFDTYPLVRTYLENTKNSAKEKGYVTTLFGRRRYIPELLSTKKPMIAFGERIAMNTPIQGTAADIIKLAMVNTDRRLERENLKSVLILQVHDELIIEAPVNEVECVKKLLKEEMENAAKLSVSLTAEVNFGDSWLEAH